MSRQILYYPNGPRSRTERLAKTRRQRFSHRGTQSREQAMAERRNSSWKSAEQRPRSRPPVARNQRSKIRGRQILFNGYSTPAAEVGLMLTLGASEPLLIQEEPCPQSKAGSQL